jgi:hypothetical protein
MQRSLGNFHSVVSTIRQSPGMETVPASHIIQSKLLKFLIYVDVNQRNI